MGLSQDHLSVIRLSGTPISFFKNEESNFRLSPGHHLLSSCFNSTVHVNRPRSSRVIVGGGDKIMELRQDEYSR
jgi:hypothetical protein